jgi:hypothetical protein
MKKLFRCCDVFIYNEITDILNMSRQREQEC